MFAKEQIVGDLKALGLHRGDCAIVHSSYRSIGPVEGGPAAVVEALADVLLPEGALLMPNLNIPHEFTTADPPRFDLRGGHIKSALGIIPEIFKFGFATHFSMHPTHSLMGAGARAAGILEGHENAGLPCGTGTPWHKNALAGGRVLLIGVDQQCNTTYHCAEERLEHSYQLSRDAIEGVVIVDGRDRVVTSRLHVWGNHPNFNVLNPQLEALGHLRIGSLGDAKTLCLDAGPFLELCAEKMRHDVRYFLR